jgi:hypothetical protein
MCLVVLFPYLRTKYFGCIHLPSPSPLFPFLLASWVPHK